MLKEEINIDISEIQQISKNYFESLNSNELENLEEMDAFVDKFNLPKLNQEDIENSPITCNEKQAVIKSLPTKKSPGSDEFSAEFYQTFKEELTPIFLKLIHDIQLEHFQIHSMKLVSHSYQNQTRTHQGKKTLDRYY